MTASASIQVSSAQSVGTEEDFDLELIGYCGRPTCRQPFTQITGRGRRRDFCSETCRRRADKEYKQAKARASHLEELLERSRHDIAAFGRGIGDSDRADTAEGLERTLAIAHAALHRARAVLDFATTSDQRVLDELRGLADAVGPLLEADRRTLSRERDRA